jgi:translation elongation factor EF-Ts
LNTYQAFDLLKEAGITDSIQTVRRWLREGKIKSTSTENRKSGFLIDVNDLKRFINERTGTNTDEVNKLKKEIELLKAENKALEHAFKTYKKINERPKEDKSKLFDDIMEKFMLTETNVDYRQKYGLSPTSSNDDVKKELKNLLKILHPDKGGNAKLFQEVKQDYDDFRKSI